MNEIQLSPSFFHYEKNNYVKTEVPFLVKEEKDYLDFECIFNKKGKYQISQFGRNKVKGPIGDKNEFLFDVYVQCEKDSPKQYSEFPIEEIFLESLRKKINFKESFFKYFKSCDTVYENTIVKDKYTIRLYKNNDKDKIELDLILYYYNEKEEGYDFTRGLTSIKKGKDYMDIELTFDKKGKYMLLVNAVIQKNKKEKDYDYLFGIYFQRDK